MTRTLFDHESVPGAKPTWLVAGEEAIAAVELKANRLEPKFSERATDFVVNYLQQHGETSGEDLTDACKASGIIPHDDRAFGGVYQRLARSGRIEKAGSCVRRRGHGTSGGIVWKLVVAEGQG